MFAGILILTFILVMTYILDYKRITQARLSQKVTYVVIFSIGFVFIAWYTFNRDLPSVLSLIHPNL